MMKSRTCFAWVLLPTALGLFACGDEDGPAAMTDAVDDMPMPAGDDSQPAPQGNGSPVAPTGPQPMRDAATDNDPDPVVDPPGDATDPLLDAGTQAGEPVDAQAPPATVACETPEEETFSFFMVSYEAIRRESGSDQGFGGDLGGISGADDICRRVALTSSDCAGNKTWRAFLSTTQQDAIDRIGTGPWHDRVGRLLANNIDELLNERPPNADPEIINDFPNEFGIPNRDPDGTGPVDNHQTLTGSGVDGRLYTQEPNEGGGGPGGFGGSTACMDGEWTPEKATCWDWTVSDPVGCPRVGHSWPRQASGVHWISVWNEGGCAPGVVLDDFTPPGGPTVGSFGGYGGFYCFAETP